MLKVTEKVIRDYFDIWPVSLSGGGKYTIYFKPFSECLKLKSCWKPNKPIEWFANKIEDDDYMGKRHQIRSMARSQFLQKPRILIGDGIIYDGNHSMCAYWNKNYNGPVLVIERIK